MRTRKEIGKDLDDAIKENSISDVAKILFTVHTMAYLLLDIRELLSDKRPTK